MRLFKNLLKKKLNANEFVKKFIYDSNKKHVQLELHYNKRIILQLENLKYSPYMLNVIPNDNGLYKDGFVVHFTLNKEMIPEGKYYKNILKYQKKLNLIAYENNKNGIVGFHYFFNKNTTSMEIAEYMRILIESVYANPIANQKIVFYLRYFKLGSGPLPGSR